MIDRFDNIREVLVYGVELPESEGKAGMATLTLEEPEAGLDQDALLAYLNERLPRYAIPLFLRITDDPPDRRRHVEVLIAATKPTGDI